MTTAVKDYKAMTTDEQVKAAVLDYFSSIKLDKTIEIIHYDNSSEIILDIKDDSKYLFKLRYNQNLSDNRCGKVVSIIKAYKLVTEVIIVKGSLHKFEVIRGDDGYFTLTYNKYAEGNPYKFQRLDYEYLNNEFDVQRL